jgi:hypothetical protein
MNVSVAPRLTGAAEGLPRRRFTAAEVEAMSGPASWTRTSESIWWGGAGSDVAEVESQLKFSRSLC